MDKAEVGGHLGSSLGLVKCLNLDSGSQASVAPQESDNENKQKPAATVYKMVKKDGMERNLHKTGL